MAPLGSSLLSHYEIRPVTAIFLKGYLNPLPVKPYPASDTKCCNGRKSACFTVTETEGNLLPAHGWQQRNCLK